jgi:hypothetical protein
VAALLGVSRPMVWRWQQRSSVAEAVPIRR